MACAEAMRDRVEVETQRRRPPWMESKVAVADIVWRIAL
jgi:hypothetical protein